MTEKRVDFEAMAAAIADAELGDDEVRSSMHTSAASVKDWDRIQAELAKSEPESTQTADPSEDKPSNP